MNSNLGEQLKAAQEIKNNDINSYVWKSARNSNYEQSEIRLVDASEAELNSFYKHCKSMLYNKDNNNPGRYVLLGIIKKQRLNCNAELFLRWLENTYKHEDRRGNGISRLKFMDTITTFLDNNSGNPELPKTRSLINIKKIASGYPDEFDTLDVSTIMNACIDCLGSFNKKHMTLKFITNKLGLWFTPKEMNEFTADAKAAGVAPKDFSKYRIELAKERCGIPKSVTVEVGYDKHLNFQEFRALIQLRVKKYSEMTETQLLVLRDKALYFLEDEVRYHIDQWENLMSQILKVAEYKGYTINK